MSEITQEMVTAAMRAFESFAARLLRYPEKDRWHVNDIQGMRHALAAALSLSRGEGERERADDPVASKILDAAWPEFGGDQASADFWETFSQAVYFTLREYQGIYVRDGSPSPDATAIREDCARVLERGSLIEQCANNAILSKEIVRRILKQGAAAIRSLNHAGEAHGPKEDGK